MTPVRCNAEAAARGTAWYARALAILATTLITGCAQLGTPGTHKPQGESWALDAVYDRTKWRWVANRDGRRLLTHTVIPKCFIDPTPDEDFTEPEFRVQRANKTIAGTRYQIITAFEGGDFWEAVYVRAGASAALAGAYAPGACQEELERLIELYERRMR